MVLQIAEFLGTRNICLPHSKSSLQADFRNVTGTLQHYIICQHSLVY